ncbi:hypothetical protein [Streptomyces sp. 1222.5]|uniref:hypothetical protein n=1 Tax=Streptomyces sp. 1222.5 TaxID=1881026 RepID=UPI003EB76563
MNQTAPIRKSLLPCTPPPEREFSSAFATGPDSEPGLLLVPGDAGPVVVRRLVTYGDWEPVRPNRWADEPETDAVAVSAVVSPPTSRADLSARIAESLRHANEMSAATTTSDFVDDLTDAVLAVLPQPADQAAVLRWAADRIDAETRQARADGLLEPDKYRPCRDASAQLRRLAGEAHDTGTQQPAAEAALGRVRAVLETEAVAGRTALEYRGLVLSALLAGGAQQQPDTETPRCAHCKHPKGDHDGRADHRAKYTPLVAGDPWCHACHAACDYAPAEQQPAAGAADPFSYEERERTGRNGGLIFPEQHPAAADDEETPTPCSSRPCNPAADELCDAHAAAHYHQLGEHAFCGPDCGEQQ